MTIMRGIVTWDKDGYDGLRLEERLPSGRWEVHSCGDFFCVADKDSVRTKAFEARQRANRKTPRVIFYYCDMFDSWQGRKFEARFKSQFGRNK